MNSRVICINLKVHLSRKLLGGRNELQDFYIVFANLITTPSLHTKVFWITFYFSKFNVN